MRWKRTATALALATALAGCATTPARNAPAEGEKVQPAATSSFTDDPYPSTYAAPASPAVLIAGATVLTGTGERLDGADVLMRDGRVRRAWPGPRRRRRTRRCRPP